MLAEHLAGLGGTRASGHQGSFGSAAGRLGGKRKDRLRTGLSQGTEKSGSTGRRRLTSEDRPRFGHPFPGCETNHAPRD
ncbi:hypothetical protein KCMC57_up39660 [Kitasatospora sp. CMC57]|uniref:Uncharacterized protein n=1 Tax=Kitasatospora sp. CMC57 TaxID=3231513 RepID=A0AB33K273_9ACTN